MTSTSEEIIPHEFALCKYLDKMPKLKPKAIQDRVGRRSPILRASSADYRYRSGRCGLVQVEEEKGGGAGTIRRLSSPRLPVAKG